MIRITEYTRESVHRRGYSSETEQDKHFLTIRLSHRNGCYFVSWTHEIDEYKNGYKSTLTIPFAQCNGRTGIKDGRFSLKYLEKADAVIATNLEKYYNLWYKSQYQDLCNELHNDLEKL